ncbi:MAG: sulfate transporter CysZ, partial [Pseudomonadota bacterium]|nr:sulfate transporter CysZ [Pseudomonadota bacterium]
LMLQLEAWLAGWPSWLAWLAWLLDWLLTLVSWLLWPLFAITILIITFYTFTLVANLIAAPFNGILAERVEDLALPGRTRPPGRPLWQEAVIAPLAELRKLGYFLLRALPLLVLFLIPVLNVAAPFLWAAFGAWMLALQYVDYPMGNHGVAFRDQRQIMAQRRLLALGFGAGVLLMTLVPVLNFLSMPTAVIGATLLWVKEFSPPGQPPRR